MTCNVNAISTNIDRIVLHIPLDLATWGRLHIFLLLRLYGIAVVQYLTKHYTYHKRKTTHNTDERLYITQSNKGRIRQTTNGHIRHAQNEDIRHTRLRKPREL